MRAFILFVCAAIIFSVLAAGLEVRLARRGQHRLLQKTSPILHPLTRHEYRALRSPGSSRAFHYVELFIGFLMVTYAGMVVLRMVHSVLAEWF